MDLKEAKKIINYARRIGVKSLSLDGLSVEFKDEIIIRQPRKPKLVPDEKKDGVPVPHIPTLDEINKFIYESNSEAG